MEVEMTRDDVQRWLDAYIAAWRSYDPGEIGALFADDATYRYHPYDEPVTGREAIVADWLEEQDAAGTWEAWYQPHTVEGDRAVAIGESRYLEPDGSPGDLYYNVFLLRFDDGGRCTDFIEYFVKHPKDKQAS
jgi:ketosteroid isomerase-like protein